MVTLDVGSGRNPQGDVNLDLFRNRTPHSPQKVQRKGMFVRGDAHYLPFRNKSFEKVLCNHTLEHLERSLDALQEMERVCNGQIFISLPRADYFETRSENPLHLYSWTRHSLRNLLQRSFPKVTVRAEQTELFARCDS